MLLRWQNEAVRNEEKGKWGVCVVPISELPGRQWLPSHRLGILASWTCSAQRFPLETSKQGRIQQLQHFPDNAIVFEQGRADIFSEAQDLSKC